jgi:hypothetical protein
LQSNAERHRLTALKRFFESIGLDREIELIVASGLFDEFGALGCGVSPKEKRAHLRMPLR